MSVKERMQSFVFLLLLLLTACSGGGGGSSGNIENSNSVISGSTTSNEQIVTAQVNTNINLALNEMALNPSPSNNPITNEEMSVLQNDVGLNESELALLQSVQEGQP